MNGFAAMLTEEEVEDLSKKDGFLHAQPNKMYKLTTTHTPKFLGLESGGGQFWRRTAGYGKGVIIGVIDTGIWPTHPSFKDDGMSPPPAKWKGRCDFKSSKLCNNKIIGARSFNLNIDGSRFGSSTPLDEVGHGTHTAGTAAGTFVMGASVLGTANGTASGIAPDAHLAIYNVCYSEGACAAVDVLAGIETALNDGVDLLSISLGASETQLYNDILSIASFRAVVNNGVLVSASAGNGGPNSNSLVNASPWILTVGASTIDRRVRAIVKLGSGVKLEGQSSYQPEKEKFNSSISLPLVYPRADFFNSDFGNCNDLETLRDNDVGGKVVVCEGGIFSGRLQAGSNVYEAGGAAMIYIGSKNEGYRTDATEDIIPTSGINYYDGLVIINDYLASSINPTATIEFLGTQIGSNPAPAVSSFSSRGPSLITPGFIKPDIIGPGVNILAASPFSVGPFPVDPYFSILSGTSMSCPHLSGIAALLKSAHPQWSPAMITSAIITTSDLTTANGEKIMDQYDNNTANFHDMGSGHVNPIRANNPGLVYDTQPIKDYVAYLCGLGYTDSQVSIFVPNSSCSEITNTLDGVDLNYPSMVVELGRSNYYRRRLYRVVTNVGPSYMYKVIVSSPPGVIVDVEPKILNFKSVGERLKFSVDVSWDMESIKLSSSLEEFGYFTWVSADEKIKVRSSMVVTKESN